MNEVARRDDNRITVLMGVTNDADRDIKMLRVDPISKRLLVSADFSLSGVMLASVYDPANGARQVAFSDEVLKLDQTTPQTITGGIPIFGAGLTSSLLIGGSAIDSKITYKSTTGAGTTTDIAHQFVGGTDGGTIAMTILNDGNVGLGSTGIGLSPTSPLSIEVNSNTAKGISIYNTSTGSAASSQLSLRSANATLIISASNYYATGSVQALTGEKLALGANYQVGMTFDTSNNVGIGTSDLDGTPAVGRLTVKGSTNDGSTNILVGRDSDEVNVFSVDTNGVITTAGSAGVSGTFTTADAKTVTVTNGIITAIS